LTLSRPAEPGEGTPGTTPGATPYQPPVLDLNLDLGAGSVQSSPSQPTIPSTGNGSGEPNQNHLLD
ncbi:hypothetical protein, partial [Salinispira pacifica]